MRSTRVCPLLAAVIVVVALTTTVASLQRCSKPPENFVPVYIRNLKAYKEPQQATEESPSSMKLFFIDYSVDCELLVLYGDRNDKNMSVNYVSLPKNFDDLDLTPGASDIKFNVEHVKQSMPSDSQLYTFHENVLYLYVNSSQVKSWYFDFDAKDKSFYTKPHKITNLTGRGVKHDRFLDTFEEQPTAEPEVMNRDLSLSPPVGTPAPGECKPEELKLVTVNNGNKLMRRETEGTCGEECFDYILEHNGAQCVLEQRLCRQEFVLVWHECFSG